MAAGALVTGLMILIHCLEAISSPDGQVSTALQEMEGRKGEKEEHSHASQVVSPIRILKFCAYALFIN